LELRGSRGRGSSSSRALLTSLLASPVGFMAGFHALPARSHKGGSKERQEDIARQTTNNESNERSLLGYWPLERTHKVNLRHKAYLYLPPARAPLRGPLPPGPAVACGRGALVKSVKLGSPPQDFPSSQELDVQSSRELTAHGSVRGPANANAPSDGEVPRGSTVVPLRQRTEISRTRPIVCKRNSDKLWQMGGKGFALFSQRCG
jgi:hypothetical protein